MGDPDAVQMIRQRRGRVDVVAEYADRTAGRHCGARSPALRIVAGGRLVIQEVPKVPMIGFKRPWSPSPSEPS